jgi:hypothetical protein
MNKQEEGRQEVGVLNLVRRSVLLPACNSQERATDSH